MLCSQCPCSTRIKTQEYNQSTILNTESTRHVCVIKLAKSPISPTYWHQTEVVLHNPWMLFLCTKVCVWPILAMRSHFLLLSKKTIITCGELPAQCGIEVPGVQMLLAMKINIDPLTYSLVVCEWWGQCRANSCKFLPSISHPSKRQIVLYLPFRSVGSSVDRRHH